MAIYTMPAVMVHNELLGDGTLRLSTFVSDWCNEEENDMLCKLADDIRDENAGEAGIEIRFTVADIVTSMEDMYVRHDMEGRCFDACDAPIFMRLKADLQAALDRLNALTFLPEEK